MKKSVGKSYKEQPKAYRNQLWIWIKYESTRHMDVRTNNYEKRHNMLVKIYHTQKCINQESWHHLQW